ncbi:hypothetical protein ACEPAH_7287 [Sanghuangporus vaninii]
MIVKDSKDNAMQAPETRDLKSGYVPVSIQPPHNIDYTVPPPPPPPAPPMYGAVIPNPLVGYADTRRRTRCRFWHALFAALLIWILAILALRTLLDLHIVNRYHPSGGLAKDYPEFDTGEALQCIDRPDWSSSASLSRGKKMLSHIPPYRSKTSFSLPANADTLSFLSRGSLVEGDVHITLASESSVDDETVRVEVTVRYWSEGALDRASVCKLERHENGDHYGVGIFTPRRWPGRAKQDQLYFDVVVRLPPRAYKSLETDYINFSTHVSNLQGNATFEKIHLKTSNSGIHADNLEAYEASLKSSNGPISGRYNVTNSLELVTSNSPIDTIVDMNSENSQISSLLLKTSNGHIRSNLFLHGPPVTSAFSVQAITSNSPADLNVLTQPHSSPLTLDVLTSNSPAIAVLPTAFEGPFILRTSAFIIPVLRTGDNTVEDPSGEGRERTVEVTRQIRSVLEGKVFWGEWATKGKGWVHVTSTNSPVELDLTGTRTR